MKKKKFIFLIIASILVIIGITICYLFIPRDTFNEKAMELYEDHSPVCYSVEEQENLIVFTFYHGYDEIKDNLTKNIIKYEFENDVLIKIYEERYCRSNIVSIVEYENCKDGLINPIRKGNIIYGEYKIFEDMKNNTKEEIINKLDIYNQTYILIED